MKAVSRFEANLLLILRFFLKNVPLAQAKPLLLHPCEQPTCLSRSAIELVQDALAKGCVLLLTRSGGWQRERFLRSEQPVQGRLWERTPPAELGLTFSPSTLRFLLWITATEFPSKKNRTSAAGETFTTGDDLLLYYAYQALRPLDDVAADLRRQLAFQRNALCRLAYPGDFAEAPEDHFPDFVPWTEGVGACLLEALHHELHDRLVEYEFEKSEVSLTSKQHRAAGRSQERALSALLESVDRKQRRDLSRPVLRAAGTILQRLDAYDWLERLKLNDERLADRLDTYRALLALPRQMERLHAWDQQSRRVGYFEEGYAASQLWKADWEQVLGDEVHHRAGAIIRHWEAWT
jgi:hypothetical protein